MSGRATRKLSVVPGQMPALIQDVARLTSADLALKFARRFGNTTLYIPRRATGGHPLAQCLGMKGAERLCAARGGETCVVPAATAYLRWLDARALLALGLKRGDVAVRLQVGPRYLRKLTEGFEPASIEVDAFVRGIGRLYGVGQGRRTNRSRRCDPMQADFGFPPAQGGMRTTP